MYAGMVRKPTILSGETNLTDKPDGEKSRQNDDLVEVLFSKGLYVYLP